MSVREYQGGLVRAMVTHESRKSRESRGGLVRAMVTHESKKSRGSRGGLVRVRGLTRARRTCERQDGSEKAIRDSLEPDVNCERKTGAHESQG